MAEYADSLRSRLTAARSDALKVHDSPPRADQVHATVQDILAKLDRETLGEEIAARITYALQDALRVLRRDDDGREAARHLATALSLLEAGPRKRSPFLDD